MLNFSTSGSIAAFTRLLVKYGFLILVFMLMHHGQSRSQQKISFKRITVDNGLPHNVVMSLLQDKKGYIWVGTYAGITRYDGLGFHSYPYNPMDTRTPGNNQVLRFFEDSKGFIWVGTQNGLNRYNADSNNFLRYKFEGAPNVYQVMDIKEDDRGNIWAASTSGLYVLKATSKQNTFQPSGICSSAVQSLYIDRLQNLWLGNNDSLKVYNLRSRRFSLPDIGLEKYPELLHSVIQKVTQDHLGNYWIASETSGLYLLEVNQKKTTHFSKNNGLLSNTVRDVIETDVHTIYVGTKEGLNIISRPLNSIEAYQSDGNNLTTIGQNSVRCIIKDREGNIWLGSYNGGISLITATSGNFFHFGIRGGDKNGLSYGIVNNIYQDPDQSFWVATDEGGLNHVSKDFSANQFFLNKSDIMQGNPASIKSIAPHSSPDKLWLGTASGLAIFDKRTHVFKKIELKAVKLRPGMIRNYVLLKDGDGLWVGTNFDGLYYLSNEKLTAHYLSPDNSNDKLFGQITALYQDEKYLWIGTRMMGLYRLDKKTRVVKSYSASSSQPFHISSNSILSIRRDLQKRLWIGTDGGGLNYLSEESGKFYGLDKAAGLYDASIQQILAQGKNQLWLSSNKGLSLLVFKNFQFPFSSRDYIIRDYDVSDGLQSNQFTNSSLATPDGLLIFGGINGLSVFNPAKIKVNQYQPRVVFTDFLIFDKSVSAGQANAPFKTAIDETREITLPYDSAYFSIKYAALSFINPTKNRFAFSMEGFAGNRWQYSNDPVATYTNLKPGHYTFHIKAANNDGIWSREIRSLKIVILPPWYQRWYAYLLYIGLAMAGIYAYIYYTKRTMRLKSQLSFEKSSREKDLALAKDKLDFFTNISHEIKTPLTLILSPIERLLRLSAADKRIYGQLKLMQDNGTRLSRLVNQLLDRQKFEAGALHLAASEQDLVAFLREVKDAFSELADKKSILLSLDSKYNELLAWFDNEKLEKVMFNLISNAIKFTHEFGVINISINIIQSKGYSGHVEIAITDNGIGISKDKIKTLFSPFSGRESYYDSMASSHLGLSYSKKLIELHHGTIDLISEAETSISQGYTRFIIHLPMGNQHLEQHEISSINTEDDFLMQPLLPTESPEQFGERKSAVIEREDHPLSILIIEDNTEMNNFIQLIFEHDFEVFTAENGQEGLELAKAKLPDLIISDVMIPEMNGLQLSKILKSDTLTSHIPIILLTARSEALFKIEGLNAGADDYLSKPFSINLLETRVWNLLENRQKMRSRFQKEIIFEPIDLKIAEKEENFISGLIKYITENIDNPQLNVEQLNQQVAMSRSGFTKKIKALTNLTGVEFIRLIRLKHAANLLSTGAYTVSEVAFKSGFEDINYFGKCFKQLYGYPPSQHTGRI
ncbi:two-component regulator propeller domain-containing protein [Pedobacter aquatilis]|uniref:hybrid sensor histidine kinase/response regulator transcription factor n=1 Tax=Pedobacter aquatilis TaxID=351343 RepID=UPI00292DE5F1|nr:two-component regulator propeller domain-containing protein [Pedobacter aquatilis]